MMGCTLPRRQMLRLRRDELLLKLAKEPRNAERARLEKELREIQGELEELR